MLRLHSIHPVLQFLVGPSARIRENPWLLCGPESAAELVGQFGADFVLKFAVVAVDG